jgi:hypothetical protein
MFGRKVKSFSNMTIEVLIIFQAEFKQRSFFDWLVSHISVTLPPHRYKGDMEITDRFIKFIGIDTKLNNETEFLILKDNIEEVYHGYDETYNVFQTRGLGLSWAPVRIKFVDINGQENVAYLITGYKTWLSTNKDFYNFLIEWLS